MANTSEQKNIELLEQIKRLLVLNLSQQGVEGKRIASVLGVDPAIISRMLAPKKAKK